MNRRKLAIAIIVAEVAQTGKAGKCAVRAFVESRMSRATFNQACQTGLAIWKRSQGIVDQPSPTGTYWTRGAS